MVDYTQCPECKDRFPALEDAIKCSTNLARDLDIIYIDYKTDEEERDKYDVTVYCDTANTVVARCKINRRNKRVEQWSCGKA